MRLPFAVHMSVRDEFQRRWTRARLPLLAGFLGPPLVTLVVAILVGWTGIVALGGVLIVIGCAVPVGFVVARGYLRRTGWWRWLVGQSAAVQAIGLAILTLRPLLVLPTVVAGAVAVLAVGRARTVLLDGANGMIAATTLGIRSTSRQVRSAAGRLLLGYAGFDGDWLRWQVTPGPTAPDVLGGRVPLREVNGVWVAEAIGAPGGPVVVVRTQDRQVQLVVGDPHEFAALLDRRLRLLTQPGWSS